MINFHDYYYFTNLMRTDIEQPLTPPGRFKYLESKGHYRPTTDSDKRHKNLLVQKRRNKKKRNKRSHKK